jgi:hypothetical protein
VTRIPSRAFILPAAFLLSACGGGGDRNDTGPANSPAPGAVDSLEDAAGRSAEATPATSAADTPDAPVGDAAIPPDTTGTVLPDAEEIVPEQIPPAAYEACKQAAAAKLAPPEGAIWGEAPDTVERTPEGDFALVAQVRPDTLQPGISYACVVRSEGGSWRVVTLEAQPAAP